MKICGVVTMSDDERGYDDCSGKCEQCNLDVDVIFDWMNYKIGDVKWLCIDCVKKNNAAINQ
ncbi:MAG: hypothetical protein H8D35_08530 [Nitrosopumilus sp.]|nr:hypothetical protein [Nitrosopumilus sp.]